MPSSSYRTLLPKVPLVFSAIVALLPLGACANLTSPPPPEKIDMESVAAAMAPPGATAATVKTAAPTASSAAPAPPAPPPSTDKVTIVEVAPGTGTAQAKDGDKVAVLYKGTLKDGTVFDESKAHGNTPLDFDVGGRVIKGFSDGVRGMKLGGKRKVTIPPSLGYGPQPNGKIPANSTLIFEIELVKLNGQGK
jgi:FKBP-type peptidyl-prolyl cis-trans isomerase